MPLDHELDRFRAPRQGRSRRTLERVVAAAVNRLDAGIFEKTTVSQIVADAGTSTGAFYARFADKAALFHLIQERALTELGRSMAALIGPARFDDEDLEERVRVVTAELARGLSEWRGVLAAVTVHVRSGRDEEMRDRSRVFNHTLAQQLRRVFLARAAEIEHPLPEKAASIAVALLMGTLREQILFAGADVEPLDLSLDELVDEVTRACLDYLRGAGRHRFG